MEAPVIAEEREVEDLDGQDEELELALDGLIIELISDVEYQGPPDAPPEPCKTCNNLALFCGCK